MSDPSSQPTQPLTDAELTQIRKDYRGVDEYDSVPRLLAEVDRLRADLATRSVVHECCEQVVEIKKDRAHLKGLLAEAERTERDALAEAARLRAENTAQAERIAAVSALHQPKTIYTEWHEAPVESSKRTICPRCTGGDPDDYYTHIVEWPCDHARALGLDQNEEGQANG